MEKEEMELIQRRPVGPVMATMVTRNAGEKWMVFHMGYLMGYSYMVNDGYDGDIAMVNDGEYQW
jgi:allophanate hydrolase subunit 1